VTPLAAADSLIRRKLGLSGQFVAGYSGNLGRAHEFETFTGCRALCCEPIRVRVRDDRCRGQEPQSAERGGGNSLLSFHFQDYQPPELLSDSLAAADVHLVSLLPALEGLVVPSKITASWPLAGLRSSSAIPGATWLE